MYVSDSNQILLNVKCHALNWLHVDLTTAIYYVLIAYVISMLHSISIQSVKIVKTNLDIPHFSEDGQ